MKAALQNDIAKWKSVSGWRLRPLPLRAPLVHAPGIATATRYQELANFIKILPSTPGPIVSEFNGPIKPGRHRSVENSSRIFFTRVAKTRYAYLSMHRYPCYIDSLKLSCEMIRNTFPFFFVLFFLARQKNLTVRISLLVICDKINIEKINI